MCILLQFFYFFFYLIARKFLSRGKFKHLVGIEVEIDLCFLVY